jgi:antitoxin component of MazEF toxin-antitoxin module
MRKESTEINLRIPETGDLQIPAEVLKRLNVEHRGKIHVRLTAANLSSRLKQRHVTEEEIERIAALQLEPRENVIKFLATESALSENRDFKRRARELRGKS